MACKGGSGIRKINNSGSPLAIASCPLSQCALHARLLTTGMYSGRHTFRFAWLLRRTTSICPGLSFASFHPGGCVRIR